MLRAWGIKYSPPLLLRFSLHLGRTPKTVEFIERRQCRLRSGGREREHDRFKANQRGTMQGDLFRPPARDRDGHIGQLRQWRIIGFRHQHGREPQALCFGEDGPDLLVETAVSAEEKTIATSEAQQLAGGPRPVATLVWV